MSSPTISDASIESSGGESIIEISDENTTQTKKSTNWLGRIFKDWTQYPLAGGGICLCCAGSAALVIAQFVSNPWSYSMYILSFTLCGGAGCNFFGCYRIRQLKPEKGLEDTVKQVNSKNQKLTKENKRLTKNVKNLIKVKKGLASAQKAAERSEKKIRSMLSEKNGELSIKVDKLSKTEKKLASLQNLYKKFKQKTENIIAEIEIFNKKNMKFRDNVKNLHGVVIHFGDHGEIIDKEVDEFDGENEEMLQNNKELSSLIGQLNGQISFLKGDFDSIKNALTELAEHTKTLDETDDKFLEGTKELGEMRIELKDAITGLTDAMKDSSSESD